VAFGKTTTVKNTPTYPLSESSGVHRRCRVAHLHSSLGVYGAERWTLALLKHLDKQEFEPVVLSMGTKPGADSFHRLLKSEGLPAIHLSVPGKLNPRAVLELRRLLVELNVDILHTHGFKADVVGYIATRGLPLSVVSTIHGLSSDESLRIRAYEAISRAFLKRFDRVYPLSRPLFDYLARSKFDPRKLQLVLNAVDLSGWEFKFNRYEAGEKFRFLFVGRLCRPKGIFDLLHAFALAKFSMSAELTVVGDGPDRAALVELSKTLGIQDQVKFIGAVGSIVPFLSASHALVLPSHAEGIPRVVMEAFAAGVPVVGTAIPGIQQLVNDEVTGLLAPAANPEALARILERLCRDPDLASRMAIKARDLVVEKYSARRMAEDFQQEYRQLCSVV
jgi:glycosyltransferase involved in cell wall biosynthesis